MPAHEGFRVTAELVGDTAVVRVHGDLDVATAPRLQETVVPLIGTVEEVVFDFAELRFLDSSGLAALAGLLRAEARPRVVIRHAAPMVRRVLDISQLSSLLTVER